MFEDFLKAGQFARYGVLHGEVSLLA